MSRETCSPPSPADRFQAVCRGFPELMISRSRRVLCFLTVCLVLIAVSPEIYAWIVTADGVTFIRNSHTRQGKAKAQGPLPGRLWMLRDSCTENISGFNKASACGFSLFLVINAFHTAFFLFWWLLWEIIPLLPNIHVSCVCLSGLILHYQLNSKGLQLYSKYTIASCNTDLQSPISIYILYFFFFLMEQKFANLELPRISE